MLCYYVKVILLRLGLKVYGVSHQVKKSKIKGAVRLKLAYCQHYITLGLLIGVHWNFPKFEKLTKNLNTQYSKDWRNC